MKYYIPIHSFVDLITNSSTEIYVSANKKTIAVLRELVNEILKIGGSELSADDLFAFSIIKQCDCLEAGAFEGGDDDEEYKEHMKNVDDCERCNTILVVTPKKSNAPELTRVLDIMNNLTGLFEYGERHD